MAKARLSIGSLFFTNGVVLGTWAVHIPTVQQRFELSEGRLGLVLFAFGVGGLVSLLSAGHLSVRFGSHNVALIAGVGFCALLSLILLVPHVALLAVALFAFGVGNGSMDVAMNAQASAFETQRGRSAMSGLHALHSVGSLAGASLGAFLLAQPLAPELHLLGVAALLIVLMLASRQPLPASAKHVTPVHTGWAAPRRALVWLGILAFLAIFCEAVVADWSAVFVRRAIGTGASTAALGYTSFALSMTLGRFVGDALVTRYDAAGVLRSCALMVASGVSLAAFASTPLWAIAGFGLAGFGLANLVPLIFSAAGRVPGIMPGHGIAFVATLGYIGFVISPSITGFVAEVLSLRASLIVLAAFALILFGLAGRVTPQAPSRCATKAMGNPEPVQETP